MTYADAERAYRAARTIKRQTILSGIRLLIKRRRGAICRRIIIMTARLERGACTAAPQDVTSHKSHTQYAFEADPNHPNGKRFRMRCDGVRSSHVCNCMYATAQPNGKDASRMQSQ